MDRTSKLAAQVDPCNRRLTLIGNAARLHGAASGLGVVCGVASRTPRPPWILRRPRATNSSCSIPAIPAVKATTRSRSFLGARGTRRQGGHLLDSRRRPAPLVPVDEGLNRA